ncbi:unnamed protein product, partial [Anisakis simplex]|uniref:Calcium/calmodulin-dependent 3',5'-cyclic nucleotide phosphodiesterase 1C n=1 Tax=Anisakis simplex TaxID=6269 RepID=A0A0M3J5J8_ANISI
TGGFNPSQKAPPLLPRPPFPPASHHAHSSSSPSSSSASQPFDANAPHQTMQGTQEECVQYTEPSQQEPIPMDIEESPMNEDENEHLRQQQSNSSDTQSQPQKSSTATAVGSHPEILSSSSAHHLKSHHDGNRAAAHQSHSSHEKHSAASGHGNRRSIDELARSRRRTTKTEDVTNGGYRPTPISDLPPRSDALLGIPVIQFERDPSVTGILKRRHAIAQQQHASSTSLSSDSPGTPNTQLVDERLNAENSSRQLTSTPPQPSSSTTKEPLAASSHHHSTHDSSIVQKSQTGGADGSIPTTSASTLSSALPSSSSTG